MPRTRKKTDQAPDESASEASLETGRRIEHVVLGSWKPNVDVCETPVKVVVRVELPGVGPEDATVAIHGSVLRVSGIKREPVLSGQLLCYYCVERRFGRFEREIPLRCVVQVRRARARMRGGILTVELPRMRERRGAAVRIPIEREES